MLRRPLHGTVRILAPRLVCSRKSPNLSPPPVAIRHARGLYGGHRGVDTESLYEAVGLGLGVLGILKDKQEGSDLVL
jgi:hypothetical protein